MTLGQACDTFAARAGRREKHMAESVYKVITLVGTSTESWEKAANAAITMAKHSLRDLRVGRVIEQDVHIEEGQPLTYRIKLEVSFKYEGGS
jgi:dodecin